jgi:hypothetical protein
MGPPPMTTADSTDFVMVNLLIRGLYAELMLQLMHAIIRKKRKNDGRLMATIHIKVDPYQW